VERQYVRGAMEPAGPGLGPSVLVDQAVELLGVSKRTVYYWIRDGRLQTIRTRCGSRRVLLSSIDDALSQIAEARRWAQGTGVTDFML
jgi:excisionase family DNA binding protein